ncbi:hypothetical protein BC826DRAFT_1109284 [Russula brevipes]|nr:hypothetical protein BC826DRAFT_1109284 [Russula brevipes]
MSHSHPSHPSAVSSPNFQLIFNNALKEYEKHTKNDLLAHPLATQLQSCDSPTAILAVLQQQGQTLDQSRRSDVRLTRWLDPTVNVLYAFSETLGEGVGLVFSPAKVIFAGAGVLLSAARDVRTNQDMLINIFEQIEFFFRRLEIYMEVSPTAEMTDIVVKIMVEVLSILALATKEIKNGRIKQYLRRLAGKTDVEDKLNRLDKLTTEEARMATAQVLKATRSIEEEMKRNQLRQDLRRWLSPPDPSTNHNIACGAHHEGTAAWFFRGGLFGEWKSTGSLLWIHGNPGCGKSILCSSIIQDIEAMCKAGQALMSYFYFDFRDINKQHSHDLLHSLLTQFSARSGPCCDILSRLYLAHDDGARQPSDDVLTKCLIEMLTLPDHPPIYLIIDALDECSNASGIPSPRERVLQLLKELIELRLPDLHICVTSRPEVDIRDVLVPSTSHEVSLHKESGQRKDIVEYVKSVVYSDSEPIMRRWRGEDKDFVIETLSEQADGMFRWVFCQLEVLRHCLPASVRRTLEELPESLDETYERVLKEIKKPNREHALRLLQCLVVAIRPLRVEELAEVLAVDFNDGEGVAKLNSNWRWEDQEQALLSSCSSLIAIVGAWDSRVVQFSHFSVKEFLISSRLATSCGDVSRYHIAPHPAHMILAQACLSVLMQSGNHAKQKVVAQYAADHWVSHAQFEGVISRLQRETEYLFDLDKPDFAAWVRLHDMDTRPGSDSTFYRFPPSWKSVATPLYYAALCGFHDLVEYLIVKHPQHVSATGGYFVTPFVAALAGRHFQVAQLLHHAGSSVDPRNNTKWTPLISAAECGDFEMVELLLNYKAHINAQDNCGCTALHWAAKGHRPGVPVQLLLKHNADIHARDIDGATPLHVAASYNRGDVARVLLSHGANVHEKDKDGRTVFQVAQTARMKKLLAVFGW